MTSKNININDTTITFENEINQKHFEPIALEVVNSLSNVLESKVSYIWFDVGSSMYDLHLEINTLSSNENDEDEYDIYLQQEDNDLIGVYGSKGIILSKILNEKLVSEIVNAVTKTKDESFNS